MTDDRLVPIVEGRNDPRPIRRMATASGQEVEIEALDPIRLTEWERAHGSPDEIEDRWYSEAAVERIVAHRELAAARRALREAVSDFERIASVQGAFLKGFVLQRLRDRLGNPFGE